ncbi:MAG: cyclic nucleotide-binding domain-containing protein [Anaerolineales bacterium]|nr:cyclic nucleotide-binding domain-containing protein [Anaerolineales bacterium]MCB8990084.1 cyclic nucleotide-binding domain-containing protein [Ardenticatenaceae bacterium]
MMISPEILRRYPFFGGLDANQLTALAQVATEKEIEAGVFLFHEGEPLKEMYLTLEGQVDILFELPAQGVNHTVSEQLLGEMKTDEVVVTTIGSGQVFAWSALLPPHEATASAKTVTAVKVIVFDGTALMQSFAGDPALGCLMTQKVATVMRERLRALRIESLAAYVGG